MTRRSESRRIAIIGSGIAGLTVAQGLHPTHTITVYEASDWIGGHTHTVTVDDGATEVAIDTGFIVCNDWTYPEFLAMLSRLGVATQPSNMSFSLQNERTGLEYNGTNLNALFAQRRNLASPSFLAMLLDILRFNARSPAFLGTGDEHTCLGEWLRRERYGRPFIEHYIVPLGRSIWSASEASVLGCPAYFFIDFFERHGFLKINNRPQWRAVRGGSARYVDALTAPFKERILTQTPVTSVRREEHRVLVRTGIGEVHEHDAVVFACHADTALALLDDPSVAERDLLGSFPFQANEVILHTDTSLLPKAPLARAAWNYHLRTHDTPGCAITYDMNILQALKTRRPYLVSLNMGDRITPSKILGHFKYDHPVYTPAGVAAQKRHGQISGLQRTFYCGAYWRYGFHEVGVVSGLTALAQLRRWAAGDA
jgi:predicted NAD/FAD-binding protein